jgi:hypothetical protein
VWTDYPGQGLINNLNLIVTDPTGSRYYGNVFESPIDTSLDTQNNVETVFLQNPTVGNYRIEAMGSNVPMEVQDYVAVYSAIIEFKSMVNQIQRGSPTVPDHNSVLIAAMMSVDANTLLLLSSILESQNIGFSGQVCKIASLTPLIRP